MSAISMNICFWVIHTTS